MLESILTQVVQALVGVLVAALVALVVKGLQRLGISVEQAKLQTEAMGYVNQYELAKKIVLGVEESVEHLVKHGTVPADGKNVLKTAEAVKQLQAKIAGLAESDAVQLVKTAVAEVGLGASSPFKQVAR